jgi:hypothetical protein
MKVTRKRESLDKILKASDEDGGEIAPSLMIRGLSKPIEGLEGGKDFEAGIKGKCRGHTVEDRGGKEEHSYDLDVHHFDHNGKNGGGKKKSARDEVDEAMNKHDKEVAAKKEPKKD